MAFSSPRQPHAIRNNVPSLACLYINNKQLTISLLIRRSIPNKSHFISLFRVNQGIARKDKSEAVRIPCCEKDNVKRGQWTPEEDNKLSSYIAQHGSRNWCLIPKNVGLCCYPIIMIIILKEAMTNSCSFLISGFFMSSKMWEKLQVAKD